MPRTSHLRPWLAGVRTGAQPVQHTIRAAPAAVSIPAPPTPTPTPTSDPSPDPNPASVPPGTRKNRDYIKIEHAVLSKHWDTLPPTKKHLSHAEDFFSAQPPTFLWSAPKFARMNFGDSPEVCFLGRSNVGKSSLLNAILGRKALANVSSKPGRTQSMNAFAVGGSEDNGKNRLVVLDMPGYGKGGRAVWGKEILKYLGQRKQMKRAFLLIDSEHGVKTSDEQLLALFRQNEIPHQVIMSKVDKILFPTSRPPSETALKARILELRNKMDLVQKATQPPLEDESASIALGEIVACSSEKIVDGKKLGIDAVRHAMLQAADLEYRPKVKPVAQPEIIPHEVWQAR